MGVTEPVVIKYDKKFDLLKIWTTFYHYHRATQHPPEVWFMRDNLSIHITLRGREFQFQVAEGKDSKTGNRPVIGVKISERVMGMMVELCNVIRFKDTNKIPCAIHLLNGNVVDEQFVKDLLRMSEAVIRKHPDYREIN